MNLRTQRRLVDFGLTFLALAVSGMALIVFLVLFGFGLMVVSFSCRGAKLLNRVHLADSANVRCACDPPPYSPDCFP